SGHDNSWWQGFFSGMRKLIHRIQYVMKYLKYHILTLILLWLGYDFYTINFPIPVELEAIK
ncbi:MAG: hypothetical protein COS08_07810, partial [Euryarchaeota archaeon CG01_land_8_20_14_3_00_38_12]